MKKIKWVKQLTRENTLLDRALRTVAYANSVKEIGRADISTTLLVGEGRITSFYYSPDNYVKQQKIILAEFKGSRIEKMSKQIIEYLEQGYVWAKSNRNKKVRWEEVVNYYENFSLHHSHSRGAIVYGYWGEPIVTEKIKKALAAKVDKRKLDYIVSVLSCPKSVAGPLARLYHSSPKMQLERNKLIKELKLSGQVLELAEILSWFTFFYELGERVSSYLFDQLLAKLKDTVNNKSQFGELMWYDPLSLKKYFSGKTLSAAQLNKRKDFWVMEMIDGKWRLLSGKEARAYFQKIVPPEKVGRLTELKGTIASLGKVTGKVKIIITQEDQRKMNKGDILVSPMTTPRLMTAIKKAAAIVTDEGGLTAHAAIVAREFGIPCIVGTKVASKIFKDGDLVEVDAIQGIVKRL